MKSKIKEIRKKLENKLVRAQKDCVQNAYNEKKEEWNQEHFEYCEGDLICSKLDLLDELEKPERTLLTGDSK